MVVNQWVLRLLPLDEKESRDMLLHILSAWEDGLGIRTEPIYIHSGQAFIHKVWKMYFFFAICILFGLQVTQKY